MKQGKADLHTLGLDEKNLSFGLPDDNYSFRFFHIEDTIFGLETKGYVDARSLIKQLNTGDLIREKIRTCFPDKKYYLIWDTSKLTGISPSARGVLLRKIRNSKDFGMVVILGTSSLVRSFGNMLNKILPRFPVVFTKGYSKALNYLRTQAKLEHTLQHVDHVENGILKNKSIFNSLWEQSGRETLVINEKCYPVIHDKKWNYESTNSNYKLNYSVVDNNILLLKNKGIASEEDIHETYKRMSIIIKDLSFNTTNNKFYSIVDLRQLKPASLKVRKLTNYYELKFNKYAHGVIMISSTVMRLLIRVQKAIQTEGYTKWAVAENPVEAFREVERMRAGTITSPSPKIPESEELLPPTEKGKIELIKKLRGEKQELIENQKQEIARLLELTGRITWENSGINDLSYDNRKHNPFADLYNSLLILNKDFRDIIEEQITSVKLLEESEEKYKNLINLATDIIIVVQDDGIRYVNSPVEKILGYPPGILLDKNIGVILSSDDKFDFIQAVHHTLRSGTSNKIEEFSMINKAGKLIPVSATFGCISYDNTQAVLVIIRDETDRVVAHEELKEHKEKLELILKEKTAALEKETIERKAAEESEKLKSAFLANMSHEIRTPLNAILAFSEFLGRTGLGEEDFREYLNYIKSNGESLLQIINDIIDFAKIEAGQIKIKPEVFDVNGDFNELLAIARQSREKMGKDHVNLVVVKEMDNPLYIFTDRQRFKQVMNNLIDNALKYTEEGSVTVGYHVIDQSLLEFYVSDTGPGIPEEYKNLIFERFKQVEHLNKRYRGTGLGLAISKNLVENMGGEIFFHSNEGSGASFSFKLPVFAGNILEKQVKDFLKKPGKAIHGRKNVLMFVADDMNSRVIFSLLDEINCQISRVYSLKEITATCTKQQVELIILDDEIDNDMYRDTRQYLDNHLPAVPLVRIVKRDEIQKGAGAEICICKPVRPLEILEVLHTYLS
jgi:PAS domain S-box-containing protein